MASPRLRALIAVAHAEAAQDYLCSPPPEHLMEATAQATQRKITLESLDLVHTRRPVVQVFNELPVQYLRPGQRRPGQVVPEHQDRLAAERELERLRDRLGRTSRRLGVARRACLRQLGAGTQHDTYDAPC